MSKRQRKEYNRVYRELQNTIKLLKKAYRKDDPLLAETIKNARRIFLHTKRPVKEFNTKKMDHFIGHALARKTVKAYCSHA